jgi:hypothetical protein
VSYFLNRPFTNGTTQRLTAFGFTLIAIADEDSGKVLLGFMFIVAGQLCSASQMIVEETFVKNRDLHPAHVLSNNSLHHAIAFARSLMIDE